MGGGGEVDIFYRGGKTTEGGGGREQAGILSDGGKGFKLDPTFVTLIL